MMDVKLKFAAVLFVAGSALAACGTAEETEQAETEVIAEATDETESTVAETTEETQAEEAESAEPAEVAEETESGDTVQEEDSEAESTEETAAVSGEEAQEEQLTWTESPEQSYMIALQPGFELTSEEPYKDVVYWSENDSVFMRVEVYPKTETDFAFTADGMEQSLQAINPEEELADAASFDKTGYINAAAKEVSTAEGKVTGIVYETETSIVRLTIFDTEEAQLTDSFIQMGQTIKQSE